VLHEAYLRLADKRHPKWQGRGHFFAVAAQLMRRILIDHARGKHAAKRGGGALRVPLDDVHAIPPEPAVTAPDVLALDQAIQRLSRFDPRKSRAIELHYFAGLTHRETAEVLGVSAATVRLDTRLARAWLARELRRGAA
jgi:RNA polymerase sigma factor (TIGR02999 family)